MYLVLFDLKNQLLIPRYPGDPDVVPFNLRLNEYRAVAPATAERLLKD
ncbi:MAG: hypothetical protein JWR05_3428 [Mucilaginibacter sp.]|nr:hypothetical protein [Mucilaginibacter sp.]